MAARWDHLDLRDDLTAEYFPPIEGTTPDTPGTLWGYVSGYGAGCAVPLETWVAVEDGAAVGILTVHVRPTAPSDRGHDKHAVVDLVASEEGSRSGPFLVCTAIQQLEEKGLRLYRSGDSTPGGYHLLKEKLNLLVDPNRIYDEATSAGVEPDYESDRGPVYIGSSATSNENIVLSNLEQARELLAYRRGELTDPAV